MLYEKKDLAVLVTAAPDTYRSGKSLVTTNISQTNEGVRCKVQSRGRMLPWIIVFHSNKTFTKVTAPLPMRKPYELLPPYRRRNAFSPPN